MQLFCRSFIQNAMVSIITILISKQILIGVFVISFFLTLLWSYNIEKLAFSSTKEKIIYSIGAGLGSISGLLLFDFFK
jgi:hypothetical protein